MIKSRRLCLALILAASVLAHLKGISAPLLDYHYHRQVNTAAIARNYHRNGLHFFNPQIDWEGPYRGRAATEFPLYMWLMGLLWPLLGLAELWGRVLSVVFSALTAVYLFKFLEREVEREAAFYAALFFSFIPLEVYFGRTVQPEALALFSTMASFYHWDRSLEKGRSWAHWTLAVAFAFLAISHKLPYAYMLAPLAALAWLRLGKAALKDAKVWLAPAVALGAVYAWYRYTSAGVYVVPAHADEFEKVLEYKRLPFFIQFQFLSRLPELALTYGGVLLAAIGARELIFKRKQFFYGVWFLSVCIYIILGGGYTFYHEYTSLPFVLVNAALMGVGLWRLRTAASAAPPARRAWAWAGLALLVASIPVHTVLRIKHWYNEGFPFLSRAAVAADKVSSRDDLFLCNQRAPSVYLYYLQRNGWSWDLQEAGEKLIGRVDEKIKEGAKFFMTEKAGLFEDKDGFFARYFYSRYPVVYDQDDILIFKLAPGPLTAGR